MRDAIPAKLRTVMQAAAGAVLFAIAVSLSSGAWAQAEFVGPKKCQECHKAEYEVWEKTKHFESFKTVHKNKSARDILKAVGDKRMQRSDTCAMCHYTIVSKGDRDKPVAGPSCESCHGPASEWVNVHNDYGKGNTRDSEPPEHKAARLAKAAELGMVRPDKLFDVASNCMACHGLANPDLPAEKAAAMLDNGHPLKPDFELVKYSQGSVRHRFYPPDVTTNKEMTPAEKSQLYLVGQAAALVSATQAISKIDHPKYVEAQKKRIATATAALEAVTADLPEAAKMLAEPTVENGRALGEAVKGKDFTAQIGDRLPKEYK